VKKDKDVSVVITIFDVRGKEGSCTILAANLLEQITKCETSTDDIHISILRFKFTSVSIQ